MAPSGFEERLAGIRERIAQAAGRSGRDPRDVTLLAVTKTFPLQAIEEAYRAGHRDFGENRVQEALPKIEALPSDIRWHLLGRLQTNKINKVLGKFVLIHSVDSLDLAQALSSRLGGVPQEVLLEVNTSGEVSKAGLSPGEVEAVFPSLAALPGLKWRGLMTIGPLTGDPGLQREAFRRLKRLFESLRPAALEPGAFSILSMGMSADFETAVEEGSTMVRIGTALFGDRA